MAIKTETFTGGGGGGGGAVTSVNGNTGAVTLSGDDLAADHTATHYTAANANIDGHLSGIDTKIGTLTAGLTYKGAFNATAGTPSIANALQGDLYIIDTAGTIYGQTWAIGDHLLINADMGGVVDNAKIDKIDNTEPTNVLITTNNLSDLDNDTTARTNLGVAIGSDVQAHDAQLDDIAGLATTDGGFIVGNGSNFVLESGSTVRTSLGLGSAAQAATTDFLASTAGLNDLSDVSYTADPSINNYVLTYDHSTTSWGAEPSAGGGGGLLATNNLSDLDDAATARTNLGVAIGTDVQAYDAQLADVAGLATTDGGFIVGNGSNFVLETGSTAQASLGLGTAATAATTDFLASTAGLNDLSDVTITGAGSGEYLRYSGSAWVDASLGIVDDTTPSLGGNLDTNDNEIITASNRNIILRPNGTGIVQLGGNTNPAELRLYCESSDHHYVGFKAPTHSQLSGSQVWRLPVADGSADQVLKTDGSGNLSFVDQAAGGGGYTYSAITADPANAQANYHYSCTGTFTITLPTSGISAGAEIRVKNMGTGTITIDPQTQEIDGDSADYVLDIRYSAVTLVSTGTHWEVI